MSIAAASQTSRPDRRCTRFPSQVASAAGLQLARLSDRRRQSMSTSMASESTEAQLSPEHIMQVGMGFWASKTLLSAIEMELFTQLAERPQDLETLRGRVGLHPRAARDFFDALVAL